MSGDPARFRPSWAEIAEREIKTPRNPAEEFERQMAVARDVMKRDRAMLHELAKK